MISERNRKKNPCQAHTHLGVGFEFYVRPLSSFICSQNVGTWIAVHVGKVVLVVLVWGQFPGADRGVERMRVGDEVRVSQVRGQVVCGGEGRRVGGRVALWRLGGYHHPADPCGILQHLRIERGVGVRGYKIHRKLQKRQRGVCVCV